MTPSISIQHLSKTFKGKKNGVVQALDDLTLEVQSGEIFGFLGPNGAGKSTTIKILMGLIRPSSGTVFIEGEIAGSIAARQRIGYLPENPSFYDYLTPREYLLFVADTFGMPNTIKIAATDSVLRTVDLWDARKRSIRTFSKGMVQRLGIAQVLVHNPKICILDEPMSGLDPVGRALVKEIIIDLKAQGKCVFFSTHITADVEQVCDRVAILAKGKLQSVENLDKILTEGILGYHVSVRSGSSRRDLYVPKQSITQAVSDLLATGEEITLIEPKRKNLEDFFLDIVASKTD